MGNHKHFRLIQFEFLRSQQSVFYDRLQRTKAGQSLILPLDGRKSANRLEVPYFGCGEYFPSLGLLAMMTLTQDYSHKDIGVEFVGDPDQVMLMLILA